MSIPFRLEGLTLTVSNVERSVQFYAGTLGLEVAYQSLPAFALVKLGGVSIGLHSIDEAAKEGVAPISKQSAFGVHVEFTTDNLDGLYEELQSKGVNFVAPPHDEPWVRSMTAVDPDGHSIEFAQGRRGKNQT